jgi:hypothetical protein
MTTAECCGGSNGRCTCGACEETPHLKQPDNRPRLPRIDTRIGTFSTFRELMLSELGTTPELRRLSTRGSTDHGIATLELTATLADVVTFYSDIAANDAYLGTATDRRAVERLTRLIGYRPRPGVAAMTWLTFLMEAGQSAPAPIGLAVQAGADPNAPTVPPPTYETIEAGRLDARFNQWRVSMQAAPLPALAPTSIDALVARDVAARPVRPNDTVLLFGSAAGQLESKTVSACDVDDDRIRITWTTPVAGTAGLSPRSWRTTRLLQAFGCHAASTYNVMVNDSSAPGGVRWTISTTNFLRGAGSTVFAAGSPIDDVVAGARLLVETAGPPMLVTVIAVGNAATTVGPVTDSAPTITVTPPLPAYDIRTVRLHILAGPELRWWGREASDAFVGTAYLPVFRAALPDGNVGVEVGRRIERDTWTPGAALDLAELPAGRAAILSWLDAEAPDAPAPQALRLHRQPDLPAFDGTGFGMLRLDFTSSATKPAWSAAAGAWLTLNVLRASHGASVFEAVGNGDGSVPFQRLALAKQPLTYRPADVPGGIASTLRVYVDGVARAEVSALYGHDAHDPVITTATRPDGVTEICFGDGTDMAARATTGSGNVHAAYRIGSGLAGRVGTGRLTALLTKPAGVRSVTNPLPSEGGADAEPADLARQNAPASVRTLGRGVSLSDLADLLVATGLVTEAQAVWLWSGFDRMIHITVGAPLAAPLGADVITTLGNSLDAVRDTSHALRIADSVKVPVIVRASIVIDARAESPSAVLTAVDTVVRAQLDPDRQGLGRAVAASDLIAACAAVPGVIGVDLDRLMFADSAGFDAAELVYRGVEFAADGTPLPMQPRLRLLRARPGAQRGVVLPAELAVIAQPGDVRIDDGGRA